MEEYFFDEDSENNDDLDNNHDMDNYKGYFVENEDDEEKQFYEFGAHFPYKYLYKELEIIAKEREEEQKNLENKLKLKELKEDKEKNEETNKNGNLKDILSIFHQKGKSRNRNDVSIGLTYMPQNKQNNNINIIDNTSNNFIKSTSSQNKNQTKDKNINKLNSKEYKKNINNNFSFKKNINKENSKNKNKKNCLYNKIRKRNNPNFIYVNNSINSNTLGLNIFNKIKLYEKTNLKNLTQDMPYSPRIKDNLDNKLQSIQYSKEKLRKQILDTGKLEQKLNKINNNTNNILNKFRKNNNHNKWLSSKYFGIQNKKNLSLAKKILSKEKNNKKKINNKSCVSSVNKNDKKDNLNNNNNILFKNKSNRNSNAHMSNKILNNDIKSIKDNYFRNNKNNMIFESMISNKKINKNN